MKFETLGENLMEFYLVVFFTAFIFLSGITAGMVTFFGGVLLGYSVILSLAVAFVVVAFDCIVLADALSLWKKFEMEKMTQEGDEVSIQLP